MNTKVKEDQIQNHNQMSNYKTNNRSGITI